MKLNYGFHCWYVQRLDEFYGMLAHTGKGMLGSGLCRLGYTTKTSVYLSNAARPTAGYRAARDTGQQAWSST
jgi:hypothetical protein